MPKHFLKLHQNHLNALNLIERVRDTFLLVIIISRPIDISHASNIFGKLGGKNRTEAVAKARLLGLLPQK